MRVEELLKPRYKVIGDWPGVAGKVFAGDILILDEEAGVYWCAAEGFTEDKLKDYPYLFRRLEWWEERATDEMPEYVKNIRHKHVIRVENWSGFNSNDVPLFDFRISMKHPESRGLATEWIPATKEEYEAYLLTQNKEA